jgi:isopenicillin N synthase-like dioxygenase
MKMKNSSYCFTSRMSTVLIPVIDIEPLFQSSNNEQKLAVAKSIRQACKTYGFFQIINHGVPHDLIDNITNEACRFFRLSSDEKLKFAARRWNPQNSNEYRGYFPASVNGKEGLDISNPYLTPTHPFVKQKIPLHELNQWPTEELLGKQWQTTITQYWDEMWRVSMLIMHAIALAFNLDETYFDKLVDDTVDGGAGTLSALRLNFYPKHDDSMPELIGDDEQPLSCETHCDNVIITILYQHQVAGLQVQLDNPKQWVNVDVVPYALVINTGRCLERFTNGILKAINHRVTLLREERLSIPFFLGACYTTPVVPLPTSVSEENPQKYESINYGPYIMKAIQQFKEYRRIESDNE